MRSRVLALFAFLVTSSAGLAFARDATPAPAAPTAPVALFVDGVKVGSTGQPKVRTVTAGRSCSSCTVMVTH